jgi:hypothetical protein
VRILNDKELKAFIIEFINKKEKESENKDYIEYSYYELKVKAGLTEEQIDEVLRVSRDYFENKNYSVYFTNAEFEYNGQKRKVETNDYMVAVKYK